MITQNRYTKFSDATPELYLDSNAVSTQNETNSVGAIYEVGSGTLSVVTGGAHTGDYYLRLIGSNNASERIEILWSGLTIGNDYTFSFYIKKVGNSAALNSWTNVTAIDDGVADPKIGGGQEFIAEEVWTKYSYPLRVTATSGLCRFYVSSTGTSEVHLDSFSIKLLADNSAPSTLPLANIVAEYKFQDNLLDTSGNGHNGTLLTTLNYVTEMVGRAADMQNTDITVEDSTDFTFGNGTTDSAFSISLLASFDSTTSTQSFIGKMDESINKEWYLIYVANLIRWRTYSAGASGDYDSWNITFTPTLGQVYHFVATTDGTTKKFYIDGIEQSGVVQTAGTYVAMSNQPSKLTLGCIYGDVPNFNHNGRMDCTRLWNIELSASQVLTLSTDELAGTDINP